MKKKIAIVIVSIIVAICILFTANKTSKYIQISAQEDAGGAMKVTIIGGSNMKENGDINSMRLYNYN